MEKTYCVYCHQCKKNGKRYIGITSNPKRRWNNGNGYKQHAFREDIQKYGWDGFDHVILKFGLSLDEAKEYEKYFIDIYSTSEPMLGYNHMRGGQMCDEETVKKINETKSKNGTLQKVVCVETQKTFESIADAAKFAGVSPSTITHICKRDRKSFTAGGFHWCYEEEIGHFKMPERTKKFFAVVCEETGEHFFSLREAERKTGILRKKIAILAETGEPAQNGMHYSFVESSETVTVEKYYSPKGVMNIDTGEVFKTVSEASKITGAPSYGICAVCKGRQKTSGGFRWKYCEV